MFASENYPANASSQSSDSNSLDWMDQCIDSIANEIEYRIGEKRTTVETPKVESEPESPVIDISQSVEKKVSTLELPCTPTIVKKENICYLKTRSGYYKEYQMILEDDKIVLTRPESSKQQAIEYELNAVFCAKSLKVETSIEDNETPVYSLLLIKSTSKQRSIYFFDEAELDKRHEQILSAQGYLQKRIEQYTPVKNLGEGSFGSVVMAKHNLVDLKVAVKFISKARIQQTFCANGLAFQEMEIINKLSSENNQNILRAIETFEDEDYYYIVCELAPAGDLFNYVCKQADQPLQETQAKMVLKQVANGLKTMHEMNIIHRDIKLENVLMMDFSEDAMAKLADFGSSLMLRNEQDFGSKQIGTMGYFAPEILRGEHYGTKADIYSLGALLYALLTA